MLRIRQLAVRCTLMAKIHRCILLQLTMNMLLNTDARVILPTTVVPIVGPTTDSDSHTFLASRDPCAHLHRAAATLPPQPAQGATEQESCLNAHSNSSLRTRNEILQT